MMTTRFALWTLAVFCFGGGSSAVCAFLPPRVARITADIQGNDINLLERTDLVRDGHDIQQDEDLMVSNNLSVQKHHLSFSRRGVFQLAGTISAAAAPVLAANADPSFVSTLQGPIQDVIAPGHWIGQFVGINSKTETWEFPANHPQEVSSALVEVLEELTPERRAKLFMPNFKITKADSSSLHVLTWTKNEWLDSLDVAFRQINNDNKGGCVAKASFYATGFLPTSIPLAPVANIAMAWFPFASPGPRGEMLQDFRLRAIQGLLRNKLESQK